MYSINFTEHNKKFYVCIIMEKTVIFVNGRKIYKFKAKCSEIVATPLCLGNISKDCSVDNIKKLD